MLTYQSKAIENQMLPASVHAEIRLRLPAVLTMVGFSRSKLFAEVKAGRFPQPERLGKRCSRWRMGDVLEHLSNRREHAIKGAA